MKKNKKPLLALILLLFIGTVGVTFAYFQDLIEFPNLFKSKPFSTSSHENFISPTDWKPGDTTPKEVTATNTGDVDVAVRVSYTESWKDSNNRTLPLVQNGVRASIINFDNITDWYRQGDYYYYNKKLSKGETTSSFIKSVTFNENIIGDVTCTTDGNLQNCVASNNSYEGGTYTLNIIVETVQFDAYKNVWNTDINLPDPTLKNVFSDDDFSTVVAIAKSGDTERYKVGDTKQIDMGTFGTHTLRIANTSAPSDCMREDFSQTACGFVLEFADIVSSHRMNPDDSDTGIVPGHGNKGGWKYSEMRSYVNSEIYNALPQDLREGIISTKVISSHAYVDTENFETNDKLYLFNQPEVGFDPFYNTTVGLTLTRKLDYYTDNNSRIKKRMDGIKYPWWLRSSYDVNSYHFHSVNDGGYSNAISCMNEMGVSPAFRIG